MTSIYWLESQYATSDYCLGLPSSFKVFCTADPTSTNHPIGEVWPGMYSLVMNEGGTPQHPYYYCGQLSVNPNGACCTSSLDTAVSGSMGVVSAIDLPIPINTAGLSNFSAILTLNAPSSAAGSAYFLLTLNSDSNETSIFGFQSVAYLPDGSCIDSLTNPIRAFSNGTLSFYNDTACAFPVESVSISSTTATTYSTKMAGTFTAQQMVIQGANTNVGWIAYQPNIYLVPIFKQPAEIIGHSIFIISILLHCGCSVWAGWKYYQKRNLQMLLQFISQIAWFVKIVTTLAYLDTVFYSLAGLYVAALCHQYSFNLASLTTTIYTSYSFEILLHPSLSTRIICYSFLAMAHIGFAGGYYVQPIALLMQVGNSSSITQETVSNITNWANVYFPYWIIIWFVWNIVPMLLVCYVIAARRKGAQESFWKICSKVMAYENYRIAIVLSLHVVSILIYYITLYLQTRTAILGNDRTLIALKSVSELGIAFHCIFNLVLVWSVSDFLATTVGRKKSSKKYPNANATPPNPYLERPHDVVVVDVVSKPVLSDLKFSFLSDSKQL